MEFTVKRKKHELRRNSHQPELKTISELDEQLPTEAQTLLDKYARVLEEPNFFQLHKDYGCKFTLNEEVVAVHVRAYRHSYLQPNAIKDYDQ